MIHPEESLDAEQMTTLIEECVARQQVHAQPSIIEVGVDRGQNTYAVIRDLMKELLIVAKERDCDLVELVHDVLCMSRHPELKPAIKAMNPLVSCPWPVS